MTDYIIGQEIVDCWGVIKFELFKYVRNGLIPYTQTGIIYNCPPKLNLKKRLQNIERGIENLEHPNFPNNLSGWEEERILYYEERLPEEILHNLKKNKSEIAKKIESIHNDTRVKDNCTWYYCDLPDSEDEREPVLNSFMESFFLKNDVMKIIGPPKKKIMKGFVNFPNHVKSGHVQTCRQKCREIAKRLWDKDKAITIADMIVNENIIPFTIKKNGQYYVERTIHNWIKDLCPDRSPGRRPKKT